MRTSFDTTANWVEKSGVSTFSPWTLANASPDLGIFKSDGGISVVGGDTISYMLTYTRDWAMDSVLRISQPISW